MKCNEEQCVVNFNLLRYNKPNFFNEAPPEVVNDTMRMREFCRLFSPGFDNCFNFESFISRPFGHFNQDLNPGSSAWNANALPLSQHGLVKMTGNV